MFNTRAWLLSACSLSLLTALGCADDSADPDDRGMDAGPDASLPDSAVPDASIDARVPDASNLDGAVADASSTSCYSPLNLPAQPGTFSRERGCACDETAASSAGYCVESFALICDDSRWTAVNDGPCFPEPTPSMGWCAARGGAVPGDGRCPSGFHRKAASAGTSTDAGIEPSCCIPLEVSPAECAAAAFRVVAKSQGTGLLDTGCAGGGELRAFIRGNANNACCE